MFGYVTVNRKKISEEEKTRYQSLYCGLCRQLGMQYGKLGQATLTYDLTFLAMLLNSIYHSTETFGILRCPVNPLRKCAYITSPATDYAADMNLILAYYKKLDDWTDDHNPIAYGTCKLLENKVSLAAQKWPRQTARIRTCIDQLSQIEKCNEINPDIPANCFGGLMGELFVWQDDAFAGTLYSMGSSLGRFIYIMDAVLDLPKDIKKQRYNPLVTQMSTDYTQILVLLIRECTDRFEQLKLEQDLSIMRNILYSGIWVQYFTKRKKVEEHDE